MDAMAKNGGNGSLDTSPSTTNAINLDPSSVAIHGGATSAEKIIPADDRGFNALREQAINTPTNNDPLAADSNTKVVDLRKADPNSIAKNLYITNVNGKKT